MAPANTPPRKKRENNFFDVGVQGRKTGITLKDTGIRDEHGLEPLEGIFSSPDKTPSPRKTVGRKGDLTITTSEEMEIQQSSMPDPAEALSARQLLRSSKTVLPPPMARSPIKTALGSSPRRQSLAPPSHNRRRLTRSPSRGVSHPVINRRVDLSPDEDIEHSIEMSSPLRLNRHPRSIPKREAVDIYDIQPSPTPGEMITPDDTVEEKDDTVENAESELVTNGVYDESQAMAIDDDSMQLVQDDGELPEEDEANNEYASSPEPVQAPVEKRQTKKRRSEVLDEEAEEADSSQERKTAPTRISRKLLQSQPASRPRTRVSLQDDSELPTSVEIEAPAVSGPSKKRKPHPTKSKATKKIDTETSAVEDESITVPEAKSNVGSKTNRSKRTTKARKEASPPPPIKVASRTNAAEPPAKRQKKAEMAPPLAQDPKAKPKSKPQPKPAKAVPKNPPKEASVAPSEGDPNKPSVRRGLEVLRQGTPMEDEGMRTTRSGRQSVAPIQWWRGERVAYGWDRSKQIIERVENTPVEPKRKSNQKKPRRTKRELSEISEEEEEDEGITAVEEWETDPGILAGPVTVWDASIGAQTEEIEEQDIAFVAESIETRDVDRADFRYAKILGLPFFNVGIVDLPAGGWKGEKNSRRMQMAFYVVFGNIQVTVASNEFPMRKGGVWQVPRGNFYSIQNNTEKPARVFFAQACEALPPTD